MSPTRQQYREFYLYLEAHPESCIALDDEPMPRLTPLQRDCIDSRPATVGEEATFLLVIAIGCTILGTLTILAWHWMPIIWRAL